MAMCPEFTFCGDAEERHVTDFTIEQIDEGHPRWTELTALIGPRTITKLGYAASPEITDDKDDSSLGGIRRTQGYGFVRGLIHRLGSAPPPRRPAFRAPVDRAGGSHTP